MIHMPGPSRSAAIRLHVKLQATSTHSQLSVVILAAKDDIPHVPGHNTKGED
jgi:hypothetical protein